MCHWGVFEATELTHKRAEFFFRQEDSSRRARGCVAFEIGSPANSMSLFNDRSGSSL
jgi:hypothetical protein